jgi:hypothetical protein
MSRFVLWKEILTQTMESKGVKPGIRKGDPETERKTVYT